MAHTGIFATKEEIDVKVGEMVDTTGYTEAHINASCRQAESFMNCYTKKDLSTEFASLSSSFKYILSEFEACWVAVDFIAYNMISYGSRIQAEDLININNNKINRILKLLGDEGGVSFLINGS
jgi:hypothetical protein